MARADQSERAIRSSGGGSERSGMSSTTTAPAHPAVSLGTMLVPGRTCMQRLTPTELERRLEAHLLIARRLPRR